MGAVGAARLLSSSARSLLNGYVKCRPPKILVHTTVTAVLAVGCAVCHPQADRDRRPNRDRDRRRRRSVDYRVPMSNQRRSRFEPWFCDTQTKGMTRIICVGLHAGFIRALVNF